MVKILKRILDQIEEIICAIFLSLMVFITLVNIIFRSIPGFSLAFSEELVVNIFVWLTILGASCAIKREAHISITLISKKVPTCYRKPLLLIQWGAMFILFSILFLYGVVETLYEFKGGMMTYSMGWPLWPFTLAIPVGSLFLILRFSEMTIRKWRAIL